MISIGNELRAAIEAYDITAISFLTIQYTLDPNTNTRVTDGSQFVHITEAPRDITHGGVTYLSSQNLAGLSTPDVQNSVSRDNYGVSFTDNDAAIRRRFVTDGPTGTGLIVQLGFLNSSDELINELLNVYSGQSSSVIYSPKGEGFVTEVSFTGQLTQLSGVNSVLTTPESYAQFLPSATDHSFKYSHSAVNDKSIKWGRK